MTWYKCPSDKFVEYVPTVLKIVDSMRSYATALYEAITCEDIAVENIDLHSKCCEQCRDFITDAPVINTVPEYFIEAVISIINCNYDKFSKYYGEFKRRHDLFKEWWNTNKYPTHCNIVLYNLILEMENAIIILDEFA